MFQSHARRAALIVFVVSIVVICRGQVAARTEALATTSTPILIELFTSEGCSSCPPADAWLRQVDASQPFSGAQAIVLSEHVDYWNHDGWRDPFSSSFFTGRQDANVRALGGSSPYTPQLILNGATELHLENQARAAQAFQKAAKARQLPVEIDALSVGGDSVLRAQIAADGTQARSGADVYAVVALNHAESQVLAGENGGHRLSHAAVALSMARIGKLEKGKAFSQDFQTKLGPGLDPKNLRLVVFVQEAGPGRVVGAAFRLVSPSSR